MAIYNPVLPYVGPIGGTLTPGRSVHVTGTIHPGATRFALNLQSGPNLYPRDDVAIHISPDFLRSCVVRNNILNMNWGPEETHGHFPLSRGQPFDITIHCERDCYKISINGQHYTDFIHRIPYERVTYFSIDGDVTVNRIEYSGGSHHGHTGTHMPMPVPMAYPPGSPGHMPHHPPPPPGPHGYYPPPPHHDYTGAPRPYPSQPYPTQPGVPYPTQPGVPYPTQPGTNYPTQPGMPYPTQPGVPHSPYTEPYNKPSMLSKAGALIAGTAVGSAVLGGNHHHGGHHYGHHGHHLGYHGQHHGHHGHHGKHHYYGGPGMFGTAALGPGIAGTQFTGHHCNKKMLKAQKKAHKKALKYGLPIAGAGVGAYALHKAFHHGHHGHHGHSSSSSSSSSSSEEE